MPVGHRSSSSRIAALLVLTAVLATTGCTGRAALLSATSMNPRPVQLTSMNDVQMATASAARRVEPIAETPVLMYTSKAADQLSAKCEYLAEDAAADAIVLRSPTLKSQIDDDAKGSISLSLSASSFHKAALLERSAMARCRAHLAEAGLQRLILLAPQTLSAAGFRAKADSILHRSGELETLKLRIDREIRAGNLPTDKGTFLSALIDGLYSTAAEAQSEADRRTAAHGMLVGSAADYSADLLKAESDLAEIGTKMRTADAYDVAVEAGYSDSDTSDGLNSAYQGFSGRVKLSMKLGAFLPQRYAHERRARDARLAAIRDQEGGALWQIGALREAHMRAISGLEDSRTLLESAIAKTRRFIAVLGETPDPEFTGAEIEAKLRVIQLESDKAAVTASLVEIKTRLLQLATR